MSLALLQQKLPGVKLWIERTLAAHVSQARPVSDFGFARLGGYYSRSRLAEAKVIALPGALPVPPLARMGLPGFESFEQLEAAGITYFSTYFVRSTEARGESLHFHELVHVLQWEHLGAERFIMAYALGHLLSGGYYTNPLEEMAYELQARFDRKEPAFDVAALVRPKLDQIVPTLFTRAAAAN